MWPFKCKNCRNEKEKSDKWFHLYGTLFTEYSNLISLNKIRWLPLSETPPINTNLLVANIDFSYFGFLYLEDGWDYSRQINMQGKDKVWPTYTNADSIAWWLNLDEIKK